MNIPEPGTTAGPCAYSYRIVREEVRYRRWWRRLAAALGLIEPADRWLSRRREEDR